MKRGKKMDKKISSYRVFNGKTYYAGTTEFYHKKGAEEEKKRLKKKGYNAIVDTKKGRKGETLYFIWKKEKTINKDTFKKIKKLEKELNDIREEYQSKHPMVRSQEYTRDVYLDQVDYYKDEIEKLKKKLK